MRDDRHKWSTPDQTVLPLDLGGAVLTSCALPRQSLISGPSVLQQQPASGWPEVVTGDSYRIALRRDRVVEVGGPRRPEGWDDAVSEASSDITDGFEVFELEGPRALDVLKRGTEISLDQPSASVARLAFGFGLWVYRYEAEDRYRIHIQRAHGTALVATLDQVAKVMPRR